MNQKYVEFLYIGDLFQEVVVEKVNENDGVDFSKMSKNCYAFRFYEMTEETVGGEKLYGKPKNYTGKFFMGGRIYSVEDVRAQFPEERLLVENMEKTKQEFVVQTIRGQFFPFDPYKDCVI